jgi:sugar/nucleoside kinase (ribokinase family)
MEVERIESGLKGKRIILSPDFFFDHLIYWKDSLDKLVNGLTEVVRRKGGNIYTGQDLVLGGCAARAAWVLSFLGAEPVLLTRTSPLGLKLLEYFFEERADLSMVKTDGELALTAALETSEANIMLSDRGSVRDFDWQTIRENRKLLSSADVVGIFSWGHTEMGTHLAQKVFSETRGLKFLDTGDPTLKSREEAEELLRRVQPDVWSMNENEARYFTSFFSSTDDPRTAADILREHNIKVVLHTRDYSYSPEGVLSPSFKVEVKRTTGAGDCWNAGYIAASISGLNTEECLTLANAVAACWVAGQETNWANIASILNQNNR